MAVAKCLVDLAIVGHTLRLPSFATGAVALQTTGASNALTAFNPCHSERSEESLILHVLRAV